MNDSLQTLSNRLHLYTLPFHANEAVTAFLIYSTTYLFASPALSKWLFPGTYPQLSKRTKINWDVRVVSLVQSTFISAFALFVIGYDDGRQSIGWKDRLWGYLSLGGTVQACAAGYFVWDVVVSATSIEVLGASSLIHAIFALLITSIGFRPFANYYGLRFVLYELSTPFLNIHWFLDKLHMTGSSLQYWNGLLLVFVFFACRLVWGSYLSFRLYADIWSAQIANMPLKCQLNALSFRNLDCTSAVPTWLSMVYIGSNTTLSILNFFWFGKMIKAVRKRFAEPKA